jgi:acetyl-CoA acetyltransferase
MVPGFEMAVGRRDMTHPFLRDKAAIAGVGNTAFGALYRDIDPDRSQFDLGAEAFVAALEDSGLTKDEIDGVLVCRIPDYGRMCDILGIRYPSFVNVMQAGGRMASITVQYAAMAVATGQANAVACIYGNNGRSVGARYGGGEGGGGNETGISDAAFGMTSPGASVAHMFRRHQHLFGTKEETLGYLAINNRLNAALNPNAVMQTPFTMEDYLASRYIAEPLRLLDYCLINDGGVCLIVTSAERARTLRKPPVLIHSLGMAGDFDHQYTVDDCFYGALEMVARDIFEGSAIQRPDIDVAEIYDNFTPTLLFTLEGLGFCKRGEGGHWITPERIARDGELPINTSGGHTSESYMQGWALIAEAVRQVRGECGDRQVADCKTALYACAAPICSGIVFRGDG